GIAPGTRFEDIPEDWVCPDCLVTKSDFVLLTTLTTESLPTSAWRIRSPVGRVAMDDPSQCPAFYRDASAQVA
ncbi:MAG: hypothetical protein EOO39_28065, partial [Cytophagaceae bacterium]